MSDVFLFWTSSGSSDVSMNGPGPAPSPPTPSPDQPPSPPRAYLKSEIVQGGGFIGSPSMFSGGGNLKVQEEPTPPAVTVKVEPSKGPDVKNLATAFGFGFAASALVDFVMERSRARENPDDAVDFDDIDLDRAPLLDLPSSDAARALRRCHVCREEKVLADFPRGRHWRTCTACREGGWHRDQVFWRVCVVCDAGFESKSQRALMCSLECRAERARQRKHGRRRH